MTDANLGFAARSKRKSKMWSQEYLSEKTGVSVGVISKFENGERVKEEVKDSILLHLGMMNALSNLREDRAITGYKILSLEELRTVTGLCREIIREGNDEEKKTAVYRKNLVEREIKERLDQLFS